MTKKLQEQLETLALFSDRAERIQALIAIGESFRNNAAVPRTSNTKVPGCESEVFLATEPEREGLKFNFAVDNPQGISAMAFAQILDEGLSGEPLEEVVQTPDDIVYQIFGRELSMGKSLGLTNMVRMAKAEAAKAKPRG
ncbi:MAG: cysteine desulfuration protein SufE [Fimbriimonadaceae bacterium]|jgi:cysteine desulfuration protein SufE|nr:cysteine desulfuration protein SufE [Fimbriimonadaceae bacterium]